MSSIKSSSSTSISASNRKAIANRSLARRRQNTLNSSKNVKGLSPNVIRTNVERVEDKVIEFVDSGSTADSSIQSGLNLSMSMSIGERLLKTEKIWYLPSMNKGSIVERLRNKPLGNFILTGSYDLNSIKCLPCKENSSKNYFSIQSSLIVFKSSPSESTTNSNNKNRKRDEDSQSTTSSSSSVADYKNKQQLVTNHPIEIDELLCFYLKDYPNHRFKSILALLEHYLTHERPDQLKLTLPRAISEASSVQQLNSLSLLEQDFWLNEYYYKYEIKSNGTIARVGAPSSSGGGVSAGVGGGLSSSSSSLNQDQISRSGYKYQSYRAGAKNTPLSSCKTKKKSIWTCSHSATSAASSSTSKFYTFDPKSIKNFVFSRSSRIPTDFFSPSKTSKSSYRTSKSSDLFESTFNKKRPASTLITSKTGLVTTIKNSSHLEHPVDTISPSGSLQQIDRHLVNTRLDSGRDSPLPPSKSKSGILYSKQIQPEDKENPLGCEVINSAGQKLPPEDVLEEANNQLKRKPSAINKSSNFFSAQLTRIRNLKNKPLNSTSSSVPAIQVTNLEANSANTPTAPTKLHSFIVSKFTLIKNKATKSSVENNKQAVGSSKTNDTISLVDHNVNNIVNTDITSTSKNKNNTLSNISTKSLSKFFGAEGTAQLKFKKLFGNLKSNTKSSASTKLDNIVDNSEESEQSTLVTKRTKSYLKSARSQTEKIGPAICDTPSACGKLDQKSSDDACLSFIDNCFNATLSMSTNLKLDRIGSTGLMSHVGTDLFTLPNNSASARRIENPAHLLSSIKSSSSFVNVEHCLRELEKLDAIDDVDDPAFKSSKRMPDQSSTRPQDRMDDDKSSSPNKSSDSSSSPLTCSVPSSSSSSPLFNLLDKKFRKKTIQKDSEDRKCKCEKRSDEVGDSGSIAALSMHNSTYYDCMSTCTRKLKSGVASPQIIPMRAHRESLITEKKSMEQFIKSEKDSFKSAITAFDILTERCSELIELFNEAHLSSKKIDEPLSSQVSPNETLVVETEVIKVKCECCHHQVKSVIDESADEPDHKQFKATGGSTFLERTLTFDSFMKSSTLLSKSSHLSNNETALKQYFSAKKPSIYSSTSSSSSNSILSLADHSSTSNENYFIIKNEPKTGSDSIRGYILQLAKNESSLFGRNISQFVRCTSSSKEINPITLMRNIRQFMNGIKNYLLKVQSGTSVSNNVSNSSSSSSLSSQAANLQDLRSLIERERANLNLSEILNVDSIIEDCLQSILLRPLKAKIYYLLVDWLIIDGSLISTSKNMKKLNEDTFKETSSSLTKFLVKKDHMPTESSLMLIKTYYNSMQCEYAPLIKLKYILFIMNELLEAITDFQPAQYELNNLNIVEFLPVLIYTVCKCKMYTIQIELEYIWNLVNKQLLNTETVYYLTLMSSACHIIKVLNVNSLGQNGVAYLSPGVIDVFLPDDKFQTVRARVLPVRPGAKCREVNSLISFVFKVYNAESYALYSIENGVEKKLREDDCPLDLKNDRVKNYAHNNNVVKFVFKQKNMNIVWPKTI